MARVDFSVGFARVGITLFPSESKPRTLHPGEFAIFFPPYGAHAPGHCVGEGRTIRKLVIKVRAE